MAKKTAAAETKPSASPAAASKKFVVGVFGAGRIGKLHIENLLRKVPNVRLKTVCDAKIDDAMKAWATSMGITNLVSDPAAIFNDPEIDVVCICSSTDTHAKFIQEAAKAKKHIFCEKPIDTNLTRIQETLAIVKQAGVKLMVGFNRRFDHNFKRVRDAVSKGEIGTPRIIKVTSRDPRPPPLEYVKVSGGLFMDMTVHDWDMARFQAGSEVEEIYAVGDALVDPAVKPYDIDTAAAILKFKNGAIGIIDNCREASYGYDQRVEAFGSKGAAMADNDTVNTVKICLKEHNESDRIPDFFLERYMGSYILELQTFFDCVANNKEPSPGGEDGFQNILVAVAAKKSLDEHRPVKLSEIKY